MMTNLNSIEPTLDYLQTASVALGLPFIDASQPLSQQRRAILVEMGKKLTKSQDARQLEAYRIFWSVLIEAIRVQDAELGEDCAPTQTALRA